MSDTFFRKICYRNADLLYMWDYPGYFSRHLARQRKLQTEKARKRRQSEALMRSTRPLMRKVRAQIKTSIDPTRTDETYRAWTALADLNRRIGEFFVTDRVEPGEEVSLILETKDTLYLRARVLRCHEYATSNKIITDTRYRYRVGVAFLYDSPEEQQAFQEYLSIAAA